MQSKFNDLVKIMSELRGRDGCPWDKEQTHETLRQYLLEEAYEVLEAIDCRQYDNLEEELGDLLLQVIFHAQIAKEDGHFTIDDVIHGIITKLIRRHPHVFGDVNIKTADQQTIHWEQVKKKEGKKSAIDGVPKQLSALLRAHRIQSKAATVGFDWEKTEQVWNKVEEELCELKEACQSDDFSEIETEFGDLLFALVNLSRFIKVNPEDSLRGTIEKFSRRFYQVEQEITRRNKRMEDSTLEEMDAIWEQVKKKEKSSPNNG